MSKIKEFLSAFLETVVSLAPAVLAIAGILFGITAALWSSTPPPERSIVAVLNKDLNGGGTGFTVRNYLGVKVIITNHHVCAVSFANTVRVKADNNRVYIRNILKEDPAHDLCMVEGIETLPALKIGSESPERFDPLTIVGHPYLTPTVFSYGQYSYDEIVTIGTEPSESGECPKDTEPMEQFIFGKTCLRDIEESMTTVATYPGNSGSPVLNKAGEVVGVINIGDGRTHYGGFIALQYLKDFLR